LKWSEKLQLGNGPTRQPKRALPQFHLLSQKKKEKEKEKEMEPLSSSSRDELRLRPQQPESAVPSLEQG